jgi:hypothetical protein
MAALSNGRFVVSWHDSSPSPDDASVNCVRMRISNADGKNGGERISDQLRFRGDTGSGGCHQAVNWPICRHLDRYQKTGDDTSATAIHHQMYHPNGTPLVTEFLANASSNGTQSTPQIATLADSRSVVTRTDGGQDAGGLPDGAGRGQVFDARTAGVPVVSPAGAARYVGSGSGGTLAEGFVTDTRSRPRVARTGCRPRCAGRWGGQRHTDRRQ